MKLSPTAVQLLQNDQTELHLYVRHNFQVYIAWFTFFITTNFVALGLTVSEVVSDQVRGLALLVVIGAYFCFQNFLAIRGTTRVIGMFSAAGSRFGAIATLLSSDEPEVAITSQTHRIVLPLYERILSLMNTTLKSLIACWLFVIVAAFSPAILKSWPTRLW